MKNIITNLPLVLLAAAIALSPSFVAGVIEGGRPIEIKAEDILLALLMCISIAAFLLSKKKTLKKPLLFFPIAAWLFIGSFSVLTNIILGNIAVAKGFFFFLKEIEFFILYFYVFYHIKEIKSAKYLIKVWIVLGVINAGWIIFEIFTGLQISYYYGPTLFAEPGAPFPSGGFFLLLFLFLFNLLLFYYLRLPLSRTKKILITLLVLLPAVGIISSGSVTSFFAFIPSLFLTAFLYILKLRTISSLGKLFFLFLTALIIASIAIPYIPGTHRLLNVQKISTELQTSSKGSRMTIWKNQIEGLFESPAHFLFGYGKSYILRENQPHNQYLQNLVDTGIIGSAIFLLIIGLIIKKAAHSFIAGKDPFFVGIGAGLLTITFAMLILSIGAEAFRIVKISEIYWFFTALGMAILYKKPFNER